MRFETLYHSRRCILSFDESPFLDNQFSSKPAGPLSKDTLSHGGSFFASVDLGVFR